MGTFSGIEDAMLCQCYFANKVTITLDAYLINIRIQHTVIFFLFLSSFIYTLCLLKINKYTLYVYIVVSIHYMYTLLQVYVYKYNVYILTFNLKNQSLKLKFRCQDYTLLIFQVETTSMILQHIVTMTEEMKYFL